MSSRPIGDYAMIGNCQSAALVSSNGSIDWWCAPRFDSPAIFARLLDDAAGHFRVALCGGFETSRRYLERSLVLETTMRGSTGTIVITDALAFGEHETGHAIGHNSPALILRKVRCIAGACEVECEIAPRPEYGLIVPFAERCSGGVRLRGGADVFVVSFEAEETQADDGTLRSTFALRAGKELHFALERFSTVGDAPKARTKNEIARRLEQTLRGWQSWSDIHQSYRGAYHDLVHHSGCVLQALTYQPTGAIVAAPTTSLPESPGGAGTWDYRYSWVRDASITMNALWIAACPDEAERYFAWLAAAAGGKLADRDLQIVFGVAGEHDLSERELPHLRGWRECRPVRVGNEAWRQRQLDVYGEVAGAAFRFRDRFDGFDTATKTFVVDSIERAARIWDQTDHGIWEFRDRDEHFLHSKVMNWQALEIGIALADNLGARDRVARWAACRDAIDAAIRSRGWDEERGSYVQSFGSKNLDASTLLLPISGFLRADDPRARSTIDAIVRELGDGNLVRRYAAAGSDAAEGAFVICSFWLAHAQAIIGDVDAARRTFEAAAAHANDVGLLAEQIDLASGEHLGNFPQAYSHVGLINAAAAIDRATP